MLKDKDSVLIIIEPSKDLKVKNVKKLINNFKTFWFYKGLLLWAKARESKHLNNEIFKEFKNIHIEQKYYLNNMVCTTYIKKI